MALLTYCQDEILSKKEELKQEITSANMVDLASTCPV